MEPKMSETQTVPITTSLPADKNVEHSSIEQRLVMQYNIAHVLAESNSIGKAAAPVMQMICETAGWEFGALWKVESETESLTNEGVWHAASHDLNDYAEAIHYSMLSLDDTNIPGHVLLSRQPIWISNLDEYGSADAVEAVKVGLHSAFILPVQSSGKVIAVIECLSIGIHSQDQTMFEMLNAVGNQVGVFLERKQLEEALAIRANQQQLLAQAGVALSASMGYENRLLTMVHVVVPDMADWCAIDVIDQNNVLRRVAAAHIDPNKEKLVYDLQPTRQVDFDQADRPQVETLLTGKSLLYTDLPFSLIEKSVTNPYQLEIIGQLDPRSCIVAPLIAHERILGIFTFVQADSRRRYLPSDLALAEEIVRRVALSLDNALLYAESQKLNAELEHRVDERTTQLKMAINQLTNQIVERKNAEEQVRILNSELEQRIDERTSELEVANRDLHKEVIDHQQASQTLRVLLRRTRELYRISQSIGTVRTPGEVLSVLLTSGYLKGASRASIAILDKPWIENGQTPESCYILAEWNKGARLPKFIDKRFSLEEYGIPQPTPYGQPIIIQDIRSFVKLPENVRKRFADLRTQSLVILPLIAGGEWYGLLSLHFKTRLTTNMDDLRHLRGLVYETAIAIKNMRLLEAESQARHEAEAANDLKLKFLAMISHELRTPLTSIKGFATTLLADDVVWPLDKQHDFLQTINTESDKLSDLIEQLLDLSRMEAGMLRISPRRHSINNVIALAQTQLQVVTSEHDLKLEVPPYTPHIIGDEQRIAQVLTNLAANAAKYSPAHTQITISVHQTNGMIRIDVADQGAGIPAQERTRVFEAFRQLENGSGSRARGAGLGLAICKGLIEAQGGKIWIQDRTGPGTVVSFTLPIADEREKIAAGQNR
jgi:signal transduction histidine kinase